MSDAIESPNQPGQNREEFKLWISHFRNKFDKYPNPMELNWLELVEWMKRPIVRKSKDGPLFSPAAFDGIRSKDRVLDFSLLVLDYDHKASLDQDLTVWIEQGIMFLYYTTYSHRRTTRENPAGEDRFRLVIPLAVPIPIESFPALWRWAYEQSGGKIDAQAKDASRMYYFPAITDKGAPFTAGEFDGALLDWRSLSLNIEQEESRIIVPGGSAIASTRNQSAYHSPYAEAAMRSEISRVLSSIPNENRNANLNRAAFALGQLVAAGKLDQAVVVAELEAAARNIGLDADEIRRTIQSGLRAGEQQPRRIEYCDRPKNKRVVSKDNKSRNRDPIRIEDGLSSSSSPSTVTGQGKQFSSETIPKVRASERLALASHQVVMESFYEDEYGDAKLLAHLYEGRLMHDHSEKSWYCWNGNAWSKDKTGVVKRLVAGQVASQYLALSAEIKREAESQDDEERAKEKRKLVGSLIARALSLRRVNRTRNILEFAATMMSVIEERWDSVPMLLAVANGVIDLRTGELRPGRSEDRIRTVVPTEWKGINEPASRFEQFLEEIFSDQKECVEMAHFIRRLFGYGITGLSTEHILPILWGSGGRNGKDTLLATIREVLGEIASPVSADVLLDGRYRAAGSASPHLRDLKGKRIVWVSETSEGARLNAGQVKWITGGGSIKARNLHENLIEFEASHLLMLMTNYKPRIGVDDAAMWERVILIPFNLRFVEEPQHENDRKREPDLKRKLLEEASGILAWLVRGCLEWQKEGLKPPPGVRMAKEEYRREEDELGEFVAERCYKRQEAKIASGKLYEIYTEWAERIGIEKLSSTAFGKRMSQQFKRVHTKKGEVYTGIGLLIIDDNGGEER